MDFSIPPHLEEKLRVVRGFVIEELFPLVRELLTRPFRELLPALFATRKKSASWGCLRHRLRPNTAEPGCVSSSTLT